MYQNNEDKNSKFMMVPVKQDRSVSDFSPVLLPTPGDSETTEGQQSWGQGEEAQSREREY